MMAPSDSPQGLQRISEIRHEQSLFRLAHEQLWLTLTLLTWVLVILATRFDWVQGHHKFGLIVVASLITVLLIRFRNTLRFLLGVAKGRIL